MKLTESVLRRIVKQELIKTLSEAQFNFTPQQQDILNKIRNLGNQDVGNKVADFFKITDKKKALQQATAIVLLLIKNKLMSKDLEKLIGDMVQASNTVGKEFAGKTPKEIINHLEHLDDLATGYERDNSHYWLQPGYGSDEENYIPPQMRKAKYERWNY